MNRAEMNEEIFDALLKVAVKEAFEREMNALPSVEELNALYQPSEAFDKRIKTLIRKSERKSLLKKMLRRAQKIVASIAVVFMLLSAVLLSVKATRNTILNAFIEWEDKYAEVRFDDPQKADDAAFAPTYLPIGYSEKSSNKVGNACISIYIDQAGHRIILDQKPSDSGTALVDHEKTKYTEVTINGKTAYLFTAVDPNEMNVLIWEYNGYVFQISAQIDPKEMIQIGESVK